MLFSNYLIKKDRKSLDLSIVKRLITKFVFQNLQLLLTQYNLLIYNLITLLSDLFKIATGMWSSIFSIHG